MSKKLLLFWLFVLAVAMPIGSVQAQCTDFSREDAQLYSQGMEAYRMRHLYKANCLWNKITAPCFKLSYMQGKINMYWGKYEEAQKFFEDAISLNADENDTIYYDLAQVLKGRGLYAEAKTMFEKFLEKYPVKEESDYFVKQSKYELEGIEYGRVEMETFEALDCKTWKWSKEEGLDNINTEGFDQNYPFIFTANTESKNKFLVFTTQSTENNGYKPKKKVKECAVPRGAYADDGRPFQDLWIAPMETDSTFGAPENMGKMVNTKANDGNATIDPTGTVMYYTICGGGKSGKVWGCSIYESKFDAEKSTWGKFEKVPGIAGKRKVKVNSRGKTKEVPTIDMHPTLADGGTTMYFVSNREGGKGGMDVWVSSKAGDTWSTPVNCGSINTPGDEISPMMGNDGQTIYFASKGGMKGFGGYDMYKAQGKVTSWSEATNLGYPINTSFDDFALFWQIQDSVGYLTSNRAGNGDDDIYRIVKQYCPPTVITVQGRVRDESSKQVIPFATVTLFRLEDDGSLTPLDTFKTQQDGRYNFTLERGYRYKMIGTAPEYLTNEVGVDTRQVKSGTTTFDVDIDILLTPIEIAMIFPIDNVYYDFDKSDLRPESITSLDKLIKLLTDNPSITIQISSHTDTNGSERYNIRLSDRRAKSVVDYLIGKGIAKARLTSFGYGESRPSVYPEMSDADEQANRRTDFRIRSMDYKEKEKPKK